MNGKGIPSFFNPSKRVEKEKVVKGRERKDDQIKSNDRNDDVTEQRKGNERKRRWNEIELEVKRREIVVESLRQGAKRNCKKQNETWNEYQMREKRRK